MYIGVIKALGSCEFSLAHGSSKWTISINSSTISCSSSGSVSSVTVWFID